MPTRLLAELVVPLLWAAAVPGPPAGRQFSAWLAVFNGSDSAALQKFVKENYPNGNPANQARFREQTGGFEFRKTDESTATHLTGLVKERNSDQYTRFSIQPADAHPHTTTQLRY